MEKKELHFLLSEANKILLEAGDSYFELTEWDKETHVSLLLVDEQNKEFVTESNKPESLLCLQRSISNTVLGEVVPSVRISDLSLISNSDFIDFVTIGDTQSEVKLHLKVGHLFNYGHTVDSILEFLYSGKKDLFHEVYAFTELGIFFSEMRSLGAIGLPLEIKVLENESNYFISFNFFLKDSFSEYLPVMFLEDKKELRSVGCLQRVINEGYFLQFSEFKLEKKFTLLMGISKTGSEFGSFGHTLPSLYEFSKTNGFFPLEKYVKESEKVDELIVSYDDPGEDLDLKSLYHQTTQGIEEIVEQLRALRLATGYLPVDEEYVVNNLEEVGVDPKQINSDEIGLITKLVNDEIALEIFKESKNKIIKDRKNNTINYIDEAIEAIRGLGEVDLVDVDIIGGDSENQLGKVRLLGGTKDGETTTRVEGSFEQTDHESFIKGSPEENEGSVSVSGGTNESEEDTKILIDGDISEEEMAQRVGGFKESLEDELIKIKQSGVDFSAKDFTDFMAKIGKGHFDNKESNLKQLATKMIDKNLGKKADYQLLGKNARNLNEKIVQITKRLEEKEKEVDSLQETIFQLRQQNNKSEKTDEKPEEFFQGNEKERNARQKKYIKFLEQKIDHLENKPTTFQKSSKTSGDDVIAKDRQDFMKLYKEQLKTTQHLRSENVKLKKKSNEDDYKLGTLKNLGQEMTYKFKLLSERSKELRTNTFKIKQENNNLNFSIRTKDALLKNLQRELTKYMKLDKENKIALSKVKGKEVDSKISLSSKTEEMKNLKQINGLNKKVKQLEAQGAKLALENKKIIDTLAQYKTDLHKEKLKSKLLEQENKIHRSKKAS